MKISIARALAESKLIDKKIDKLMASTRFCAVKYGVKEETHDGTKLDAFNKDAQSGFDKIKTLLDQKHKMKAMIVKSNAETIINVGKTSMTVAAAIERKRAIVIEMQVLRQMKEQYLTATNKIEGDNMRMEAKLNSLLEANFGSGKQGSVKQEELEAISKPYVERHEAMLVDPLGIKNKIDEMEASIDEFVKNVDFALNESNVRTEIEVDLSN